MDIDAGYVEPDPVFIALVDNGTRTCSGVAWRTVELDTDVLIHPARYIDLALVCLAAPRGAVDAAGRVDTRPLYIKSVVQVQRADTGVVEAQRYLCRLRPRDVRLVRDVVILPYSGVGGAGFAGKLSSECSIGKKSAFIRERIAIVGCVPGIVIEGNCLVDPLR